MQPSIVFSQVKKEFLLQEDRTFKEFLPSLLSGKGWATAKEVLHGISFTISQGETVALVGKNGAGKSTILKLIAGVTYPSSGSVAVQGQVAPLIELGAGFHHELSGYENIFLNAAILGMHKKEIELCLSDIIAFSELEEYLHVPLKKYSTGMQMRLAFSIAIHTPAPILLVDEVLAVGDADFQKKCLNRLTKIKEKGDKIIVFVSHDEKSVVNFCERAILLEDGKVIADNSPTKIFNLYQKESL